LGRWLHGCWLQTNRRRAEGRWGMSDQEQDYPLDQVEKDKRIKELKDELSHLKDIYNAISFSDKTQLYNENVKMRECLEILKDTPIPMGYGDDPTAVIHRVRELAAEGLKPVSRKVPTISDKGGGE